MIESAKKLCSANCSSVVSFDESLKLSDKLLIISGKLWDEGRGMLVARKIEADDFKKIRSLSRAGIRLSVEVIMDRQN